MTYDAKLGSILGYIAGSLVVSSDIFQIINMIKLKDGSGISGIFLGMFVVVCALYITSGIIINVPYIYIINIINETGILIIICIKAYYYYVKKHIRKGINDKITIIMSQESYNKYASDNWLFLDAVDVAIVNENGTNIIYDHLKNTSIMKPNQRITKKDVINV